MDESMNQPINAAGDREGKVVVGVTLPGPRARALAAWRRSAGGPKFGVLNAGNAAPPRGSPPL